MRYAFRLVLDTGATVDIAIDESPRTGLKHLAHMAATEPFLELDAIYATHVTETNDGYHDRGAPMNLILMSSHVVAITYLDRCREED